MTTWTKLSENDLLGLIQAAQGEIARRKTQAQKKKVVRRVVYPATAEQLARFYQFCELHGVKPNDDERRALCQIVEKLERRLREREPGYRFHALAPAKTGRRQVNRPAFNRKTAETAVEHENDLFGSN